MNKQNGRLSIYLKVLLLVIIIGLIAFGTTFSLSRSKSLELSSSKCDQKIVCVALREDRAEPDAISVPIGGYAQFNSADNKMHNIAEGSGDVDHDGSHVHSGKHLSGDFKANEGWKVQFNKTGTFEFHDHYNPKINFIVIVYQPDADYKLKL